VIDGQCVRDDVPALSYKYPDTEGYHEQYRGDPSGGSVGRPLVQDQLICLPDPPEERHDNARSLSEDIFSCIFHHDDLVIGALYFLLQFNCCFCR